MPTADAPPLAGADLRMGGQPSKEETMIVKAEPCLPGAKIDTIVGY